MRQFLQLSVALMALLPSAVHASAFNSDAYAANDSVKVKAKSVVAEDVRTVTGTVYDAATNYPLAGVRVQAAGNKRITAMTDSDGKYKIISVFKTNTLSSQGEFFNYLRCCDFQNDKDFMNYVYNVRIRSLINCPVTVNEDDELITLSTCSYEFTNFRTVVVARKVRIGEEAKVAIRNIRRDANDLCKKMKKDGEMTEDEQKASEKSVQDLTDKYVKEVDVVTAKKEKEIMQI